MIKHSFLSLTFFTVSMAALTAHDVHYAVGAAQQPGQDEPVPGSALMLVGPGPAGKTFHLLPRPVGQRGGGWYTLDEMPRTLHPSDGFAINALSNGTYELDTGNHAHTGSWIWAEIASVTGPDGGVFAFWDENQNSPTHQLPANQPTGSPAFVISEGIDDEDEDPQGHIHTRVWTASKPGVYLVGIRFVDRSTNRPGGAPWHQPSPIYTFRFEAGPAFQPAVALTEGKAVLTWSGQMGIYQAGGQTGIRFAIQRSTTLGRSWEPIGTVTATTAPTVTFTDLSPPEGNAFYRLAYDWSTRP